MKKSLAKAITLTLLLANTAFAADSVNNDYNAALNGKTSKIDLNGYGQDEIKNTATKDSGVLFDGGWYAPDGKFYCYVDEKGNKVDSLQCYNSIDDIPTATKETLGTMGLDRISKEDSLGKNDSVLSYKEYFNKNGFDKDSVSKMLTDNMKFNNDLTRTVVENEEAERKETDKYLNWKVDNIKVEKTDANKNSFTFTNGEGQETIIDFTFTDADTKLDTESKGLTFNDGKITLEVKDKAGNIVDGTADVGEYIKEHAGDAYYENTSTTINQQITNNKKDIQTVKNNYVKNITQKEGDEYTVTQIINGTETPVTYKDKHITGFEQSIDEDGKITSTITTNFEEKPYQQTINISGYVGNAILYNAGNAYYDAKNKITINKQITSNKNNIADNTNRIEAVEKDYVKNIEIKDGDTLHITETVSGETKYLDFKDTHIDKLEQSIDKDGKITTIITDNNDKTYTGTVDVGSYIKENAGDAYYDKKNNITINEQITNISNKIEGNTDKIDTVKNDYVQNISQNGDKFTIKQHVNGKEQVFDYTDKHVDGFTQSGVGEYGSDDAGKITSTIKTNYGESYSDTIDISGYVSDVVKNEAKDGSLTIGEGDKKIETTIGEAINNNYNTINQIKNDYVQNITQEGDTLKITQNVDGKKDEFTFTDKHINSFEQSMDGYGTENGGKIISTIKDNVGNEYQQIIDVGGYISDAIKNEAGDAYYDKENKITINDQISNVTGDIDSVKKNYVQNITQEGDTLTIKQHVNGDEQEFKFTDEHINGFTQSETGKYGTANAGQITSTITTNKGEEYKQTIDISDYVSDAVKNEAKDAIITVDNKQTTIENAVKDNYINITEVKNNYVKNVGVDDKNGVITIVQNKDGVENTIEYTDKHITGFNQSEVGAYGSKEAGKITSTITTNFGDKYEQTVDISGYVSSTVKNEAKDGDVTVNGNKTTIENALQNNANEISQTNQRLSSLGGRINKVGAGAAALAALHPMDFDPDDKLTFSAGYGNYAGENAAALGMFYRPDEKVMFSLGGTMGNGENMVNAGISFALDRRSNVNNSKIAMAHEIQDLREQVARQNKQIAQMMALVSQLTGKNMTDTGIMFSDVPENHWAYDYIKKLAAAGIVEGYGDGQFLGDRSMTRYEFAAMLYRALNKGVQLDAKILNEFEPELGRIRIDRISGADSDKNKVERVRVITAETRDVYGSKLN